MPKSTKSEVETRVTAVYQLLLRQQTYSEICRYATIEWHCSARQTDRYIRKARERMATEAAILRRNEFDYQLAIRRHLYSQAYRDHNWRLCLNILKDQAQLLGGYPTKIGELQAIRQLVDANILPLEVLEEISTALGQFQQSALAAIAPKNSYLNREL